MSNAQLIEAIKERRARHPEQADRATLIVFDTGMFEYEQLAKDQCIDVLVEEVPVGEHAADAGHAHQRLVFEGARLPRGAVEAVVGRGLLRLLTVYHFGNMQRVRAHIQLDRWLLQGCSTRCYGRCASGTTRA